MRLTRPIAYNKTNEKLKTQVKVYCHALCTASPIVRSHIYYVFSRLNLLFSLSAKCSAERSNQLLGFIEPVDPRTALRDAEEKHGGNLSQKSLSQPALSSQNLM